jgi:hypothetical protein
MPTGQPRSGCCCERFLALDEAADRLTGREVKHHCCPIHGRQADGVPATAR